MFSLLAFGRCDEPARESQPQPLTDVTEARIVAGTSVRVRAEPSADAKVVGTYQLGTGVTVNRTDQPSDTTWVRVSGPLNLDGYIRADLTRRVPPRGRVTTLEAIATERLAQAGDFSARVELFDMLGRASEEPTDEQTAGRLALLRIQSLRALLRSIPRRFQHPPFDAWLAANDSLVLYDEIGAHWMVRTEVLRAIHEKHIETTSSDEIAWLIRENGLRGECEGMVVCYISSITEMDGEYLRQHPDGSHVVQALKRVGEVIKGATELSTQKEYLNVETECPALVASVARLRASIEGVSGSERDELLASLGALSGKCSASEVEVLRP